MFFSHPFSLARKYLNLERKGSDFLKSQIFLKLFLYIKILPGNKKFQKLLFCK